MNLYNKRQQNAYEQYKQPYKNMQSVSKLTSNLSLQLSNLIILKNLRITNKNSGKIIADFDNQAINFLLKKKQILRHYKRQQLCKKMQSTIKLSKTKYLF